MREPERRIEPPLDYEYPDPWEQGDREYEQNKELQNVKDIEKEVREH